MESASAGPWLIIKNLDQDERRHRDRCRTTSMTICSRHLAQRMVDAATTKPPAFDVILVHSFSRFFRDQFQLEFYVRRLAKAGVRLVSITQELGDDPMSNMIRQIMVSLTSTNPRRTPSTPCGP